MFFQVIFAIFILFLLYKLFIESDPPKLDSVYSQRGKWYWLKFFIFYIMVMLRKRQNKAGKAGKAEEEAGYGKKSRSSIEDMDKIQTLPIQHPKAVDAVYFNGANKDGVYFVGATARRHENLVQTILYIRIPELGLLEIPSLPDTSLKADVEATYSAGGLSINVVEPMKKWRLTFEGSMRLIRCDGTKSDVMVSFDFNWNAYTGYFDFDTDLHPTLLCDGVAREEWSRRLFDDLKLAHQTHYEQFGELTGLVHIDIKGYEDVKMKLQGVRDHSYGNLRDWRDLHRYAIQYIHLENSTAICIGSICMPRTMTRLIIGYVFLPGKKMDAVDWSDLELYQMGEDGNDPTDFNIKFTAGGMKYNVQGHVLDRPIFYMGYDWETRIHERMCSYVVNGIPGWGISEWCYRNHSGVNNPNK